MIKRTTKKQWRVKTQLQVGYKGCDAIPGSGWLCSNNGKDEKMCWTTDCTTDYHKNVLSDQDDDWPISPGA